MLHRMSDQPPSQIPAQHSLLLYLLFFASGAAALAFEQLWFRLAGLSFGNTVWASTTVLAAFMGGLALGNALAAWGRLQLKRPLLWYAAVEAAIAISGISLLWLLPNIGQYLSAFPQLPGLRISLAFLLMLLPATAMGLTLPLVVRALMTKQQYGSLLGRLYGLNTLGAVAGVLAAEYWLIGRLGMMGTGLAAAGLNLAAGLIALWLNSHWPTAQEPRSTKAYPFNLGANWLLVAALSGAALLALEVVWFRLLLLHVRGTASVFAAMLAMVLVGIGLGGLLAALALRWRAFSRHQPILICLLAALAVSLGYRFLPAESSLSVWLGSACLMLSTALASGALFPLLCAGYAQLLPEPSRATARMLVANTTGGMLGAALTGLLLLPSLGIHISLCLLMICYLLCAALLAAPGRLRMAALLTGLAAALLFPWQGMPRHLEAASEPWRRLDGSRMIYQREGTERDSRRYMKLFAWLPMALHPQIEDVLLISYGLGSTAEALVADPQVKAITVVDISEEILEASRLTHVAGIEPLDDPRLQVEIEDGRHFLLTRKQQFDLITGEPPPPRLAGVVNLYTREYFELMRQRLKPGGLASYWLPVDQLSLESSRAILAAFCAAFEDCSLWSGSNYNWILLGSKTGRPPLTTQAISRLWQTPGMAADISALGFERPAQLGASFLADAAQLKAWIKNGPPLTDDKPKRLDEAGPDPEAMQQYARWLDNQASAQRFERSEYIRSVWPHSLREETLGFYEIQPILNNEIRSGFGERLLLVDGILQHSQLKIPVFWLLNSGIREQQIIDRLMAKSGYRGDYAWHLAVRALAERRFSLAAELLTGNSNTMDNQQIALAAYSLCRSGQVDAAQRLSRSSSQAPPLSCW